MKSCSWSGKSPVEMSSVEIKFDTNLHRKIMMHKNPAKNFDQVPGMPPELVKNILGGCLF